MGTVIDPVPVAGLAANFSPMPRIAPPPFGNDNNAHPIASQKLGEPQDHRHRLRTIRKYEYLDAATLLDDFWKTVDAVLREKGVIP